METAALMSPTTTASSPWIHGRRWDLGWLIGSAVVVPLVLALVWMGASSLVINLGVTALVGGPHVFSTFLTTHLDPRFRRAHWGVIAAATLLVPAFVVVMTLWDFQVLLSVFIFAASIHVLQQNAYLTDIYRRRAKRPERAWSRAIDYGLLGLSFYPIASYKLVHDDFVLGGVRILIPGFTKLPATYWIVSLAFGAFLAAWLAKTAAEARRGELNAPKTLLIAVTASIAFLVPAAAAGRQLELAFQSVNMWHSIQYLGIVWIVLKVRKDAGLVDSPFVAGLCGPGRAWRYYGTCVATTIAMFGVIALLVWADPLGRRAAGDPLAFDQYYYMTVLSALLIHYVLDGYLFAVGNRERSAMDTIPFAAPASA